MFFAVQQMKHCGIRSVFDTLYCIQAFLQEQGIPTTPHTLEAMMPKVVALMHGKITFEPMLHAREVR
jgi:hypothetical protein